MRDQFVPHYREIERVLRDRIAGLKPGAQLPSDAEMCREFGVSRMTARNAMQRLAEDGLVRRMPGLGTFVAHPPEHRRANRLMSFTREMQRVGLTPSSRLLSLEMRPATQPEADALGRRPGDPVLALRRIRLADEVALVSESAVLDPRTAPAVMAADLVHGSLHEALRQGGHRLRRGSATISAECASVDDAVLLGLPAGEPLLVERRVILDDHGRPIEVTESRYRADRYALDVLFDVDVEGGDGD